MKKKITVKEKLRKIVKGERRKAFIGMGLNDSRFVGRVIPDKKKRKNKRACRKKVDTSEE